MSDVVSEDIACKCYACQKRRRSGEKVSLQIEMRRSRLRRKLRNNKDYYKGLRPLFGTFRCTGCKRKWTSINSWEKKYQECAVCLTRVYPYFQRDTEEDDAVAPTEAHLEKLCEMCKTVGCNCGRHWSLYVGGRRNSV